MTINTIAPYQFGPLYSKSATTKTASSGERVFSIPDTVAIIQNSKAEAKKSSTLFEELGRKYDIRNATFEEITEIGHALYEAGELSLRQLMIVTFDYERSGNDLKQYAKKTGIPVSYDFSMYRTQANRNDERDWIAEIKAKASEQLKDGNLIVYQDYSKLIAILQKLDVK